MKNSTDQLKLFCEALADIAYFAGEAGYYSGNSREDMQKFISLAWEFEKLHEHTDWNEQVVIGKYQPDYLDAVNTFAVEKLKLRKKLQFVPAAAQGRWDDTEVSPVHYIGDKGEDGIQHMETCEEEEADLYSVYLHQLEGGVQCIADLPTKELAEQLAQLIENACQSKQFEFKGE